MFTYVNEDERQGASKRLLRYFRYENKYKANDEFNLESALFEAFSGPSGVELSKSCQNSLRPGDDRIFMNHYHLCNNGPDGKRYFFGELVSLGQRGGPSVVDERLQEPILPIIQVNPPAGMQWALTPLYFLVKNNHVIVSTSQLIKERVLEEYLFWLLCTKTKVAGNMSAIRLRCELDRSVLGNDLQNIKSIAISDPSVLAGPRPSSLLSDDEKRKYPIEGKNKWGGEIVEFLRSVFGEETVTRDIYERATKTHNIKVDIGFSFERKANVGRVQDIMEFVNVFREMPDEMIEFRTKTSVVKNGSVRLQVVEDIKTIGESKIIDPEDMERAMFFYYHSLVEDDKIAP